MVKQTSVLAVWLCLIGTAVVFAATGDTTWTGRVSTDWAKAENWSDGVPDGGDGFKVIIPGYLERNPVLGKDGGETGGDLIVQSGAKFSVDGELGVHGAILIEEGAEVQVGEDCTLKSNGNNSWNIKGTLTLLPGSTAWAEPDSGDKTGIVVKGSLIAKGTAEKWITIKGSPYPRRMSSLQFGEPAVNIVMDYVTMPDVLCGIACSTSPRRYALSHLKVGNLYSLDLWSGARLLVSDSTLVSPVHLYSYSTLELVRCRSVRVNFNQGLKKGGVISREDVDNNGAYVYWGGSEGVRWHAGSVPPAGKDNVIIRDNTWSKSDFVVIDADAVCNNLTVDPEAKLVIKEGVKLTLYGELKNSGSLEAAPDAVVHKKTGEVK